jgi:hypothetical protein
MCFGSKSPSNPVTKPSYSVDDMYTAVKSDTKDAASATTTQDGMVDQRPATNQRATNYSVTGTTIPGM